jgi:predicted TPR repeat methyltransferase
VERYFIKSGYKSKTAFEKQRDSVEDSMIWQYEVYEYASRLIKKHHLTNVLDIGCGCGVKLKKLILPVCQDITGIDEPDTISWCKQHHDFGTWYADNLEDSKVDLGKTFDLIISADVIEHLVDPDRLLGIIKKFAAKETLILLSTPERDATRGKGSIEPPLNTQHIREWNFDEFEEYIGHSGFRVIRHFRLDAYTSLLQQDRSFTQRRARRFASQLLWYMTRHKRFRTLPFSGQAILAVLE